MADPVPTFTYLIRELRKFDLSYLHLTENWRAGLAATENPDRLQVFVDAWLGPDEAEHGEGKSKDRVVLIAGGFKPETAKERVDEKLKGKKVGIVFGRYWISNLDLVWRLQNGVPLREYDTGTFYTRKSEKGYIDYGFAEGFEGSRL